MWCRTMSAKLWENALWEYNSNQRMGKHGQTVILRIDSGTYVQYFFSISNICIDHHMSLYIKTRSHEMLPGDQAWGFAFLALNKPLCLPARRQVFLSINYTRKYNFWAGK